MYKLLITQKNEIKKKIQQSWTMAEMFLANKDAHGIQDAGVEIQALERSLKEIELLECKFADLPL